MLLGLTRLGRLLGGLLLATVLLAGCTDDEPDPDPSPSPSPSDSASSPTASPSAEPESAEEFIERWVQVDTEMQNTGATDEYRAMSPDCRPCNDFADTVEKYYRRGGFIETEGWLITSVERTPDSRPKRPTMVVAVKSRPTRYQPSSSAAVQTLPGGRDRYQVTLVQSDDSWLVTDLIEIPS